MGVQSKLGFSVPQLFKQVSPRVGEADAWGGYIYFFIWRDIAYL